MDLIIPQLRSFNISYELWDTLDDRFKLYDRLATNALVSLILFMVATAVVAFLTALISIAIFLMPLLWAIAVLFKLELYMPQLWDRLALFAIYHVTDGMLIRVSGWFDSDHSYGLRSATLEEREDNINRLFRMSSSSDGAVVRSDEEQNVQQRLRSMCMLLTVSIVFEFFTETIPQLAIQGSNNSMRDSWTAFALFSFGLSLFFSINTLWRIVMQRFLLGHAFGSPKSWGIDEKEFVETHRDQRQLAPATTSFPVFSQHNTATWNVKGGGRTADNLANDVTRVNPLYPGTADEPPPYTRQRGSSLLLRTDEACSDPASWPEPDQMSDSSNEC